MEKITTASRIHPLMAAAALSVITISAVGTAAIAGWLPNSQAQTAQLQPTQFQSAQLQSAPAVVTATPAQQLLEAQQLLAAQQALAAQRQLAAQPLAVPVNTLVAPASAVLAEPTPRVHAAAPKTRVVYRDAPQRTRVVYRDAPQRTRHYSNSPSYQAQAPAPQPRQPNYVGIGTGAVIGGLLGNQVGGGNGKKLATVAGIIGGGYLGNEMANRYQQR
ncbi:glycine zipper 2TM domain-containing protein [Massilia sp. TSP1-1-2]|uniref:glycine zipper 2TM domain-containing protein n=1 Tax=Massilia sp. TSP1-1-2 TaxID=2804649 RepID=UPI003CEB0EF5